MNPSSDTSAGGRHVDVLRWFGVVPAAVLGDLAASFAVGAILQVAGLGAGSNPGRSVFAHYSGIVLFYVSRKIAFVVAGAKMAPRRQMTTAIVLAVAVVCVSLMTHVVGQHLAGNRVGSVNYTHMLAESAGALVGAAYIYWHAWRNRRRQK